MLTAGNSHAGQHLADFASLAFDGVTENQRRDADLLRGPGRRFKHLPWAGDQAKLASHQTRVTGFRRLKCAGFKACPQGKRNGDAVKIEHF